MTMRLFWMNVPKPLEAAVGACARQSAGGKRGIAKTDGPNATVGDR
jgi:hypothetical protein